MSARYSKKPAGYDTPAPLTVTHPHAAGIDIHLGIHWVAVPPTDAPPPPTNHPANLPPWVRSFGTCTADLEMLADWLKECGVTTVAMESTGIYWITTFELLERRGFEVYLVEPRQSKRAPGRPKTDVLDCQWLQRLHSYGLLTASFRPADQVVVLRSYLRQRQMLIGYGGQHIQHMQKALEQMNVKLTLVVSDVTGVTGMAIIKAIVAGERDPLVLAKLRNNKCQHTEEEIARALYGNWREEHLFALQQALELYLFYQGLLQTCDQALAKHLGTFTDQSGGEDLAAQTPKTQEGQQCSALRCPPTIIPDGRRRFDRYRGHRRSHRPGHPERDRHRRVEVPFGQALRQLAGAVPSAPGLGRQNQESPRA